jgi:hypothetical protein
LTGFSENVFVEMTECRWLVRFWLERGWVRDVRNFTYPKCEGVSVFFGKWGSAWFRGVFGLTLDIGGVSGIMMWPSLNANAFLITGGDFKFRVSDKGVEGFVPPYEEPGVIDEFKG